MTDLAALPTSGEDEAIHVVVESPRGSTLKLKYDTRHRVMTLSRPLTVGLAFPFDFGFVPSTRAPDGDPLDAFLLWDAASYPGIVIPCRALGVLQVEQSGPSKRRERLRREVEQFFATAVTFEGKDAEILGWGDVDAATALVKKSKKRGRGR